MKWQVLSHAGLKVESSGVELLCDPWLLGSCYWRSWWNYPPVPQKLIESLKPNFIAITHLHWDHFHGPSLRLFDPATPVIVPYERYDRMVRDLRDVGMTNIIELRHGESIELGPNFRLTSYHFMPFGTDSALVIEADGKVLLNANDAKLAGGPLNQLLRNHPKIDFALRSHSSANPRANYYVIGEDTVFTDDVEYYLWSFSIFMKKVRPRYAIPFASSNCVLHDDAFAMNSQIQTPVAVADYFRKFAAEHGLPTEIQIMVPGDNWSSEGGFDCAEHDWFENRDAHLISYQKRIRPTLDRQAGIEARVRVTLSSVEKFVKKVTSSVPKVARGRIAGEVLLVSRSAKAVDGFAVDLGAGTVRIVDESDFASFDARIEFPALILLQSLRMGMFGHAAISRRVNFYATPAAMPRLKRFSQVLLLAEPETLPISANFSRRSIRAALPRWREGMLYLSTAAQIARGRSMVEIEKKLLDN